jgi:hypothetical protein
LECLLSQTTAGASRFECSTDTTMVSVVPEGWGYEAVCCCLSANPASRRAVWQGVK